MKITSLVLTLPVLFSYSLVAQAPQAVSIDQESHHHLALRNDYVEVHQIILPPGEAFKLHRHDTDEIAITISGASTIGETLGKPPVPSTSQMGRVGYSPAPRVHLVRNVGTTTLHNVAVSLLHPQANLRNLCATPVAGQPKNCPSGSDSDSAYQAQPQFETDQTLTTLIRVKPNQSAPLSVDRDQLVVAIEEVSVVPASGASAAKVLHSGDFVWIARGGSRQVVKNSGDKEARFVTVEFKPL